MSLEQERKILELLDRCIELEHENAALLAARVSDIDAANVYEQISARIAASERRVLFEVRWAVSVMLFALALLFVLLKG